MRQASIHRPARARCQGGNPASLLVVPTIARGGPRVHTADMAPGSEPLSPITDGCQPSPAWRRVETLGVAQIVVLILEARKTMPWATAATVSRERHDDAFRVRVSLLKGAPQANEASQVSQAGRADPADQAAAVGKVIADFTVGRLDKDLTDAFGDKDVITLK